MKRILCTIAVALTALVLALPARAQLVQFGFKGGLNFTKLGWPNKTEIRNVTNSMKQTRTGFFLGPMIELNLPVLPIGFDGAIVYSLRGGDAGRQSWKQSGFEVPLHVKYTFGLGANSGVFIAAGPDLYLNLRSNSNNAKYKVAQLGINVGAGFKITKHYRFGAEYLIPATKSYGGEGKLFSDTKVKGWQVNLAYLF
ncbi:MAG: porin family protein [Prevotellaceae bacterium]|nr:porin family protein [Prevotellaceae bacterium]